MGLSPVHKNHAKIRPRESVEGHAPSANLSALTCLCDKQSALWWALRCCNAVERMHGSHHASLHRSHIEISSELAPQTLQHLILRCIGRKTVPRTCCSGWKDGLMLLAKCSTAEHSRTS
mmetsp:Transcript_16088/g.41403  ORF Transcript_16088/g.41403 Transcript_16088/m.41403 type:complete len:119 (+) Transcript_16088:774-1130(+)